MRRCAILSVVLAALLLPVCAGWAAPDASSHEEPPVEPRAFSPDDAASAVILLLAGTLLLLLWQRARSAESPPPLLFCPWGALEVLLGLYTFIAVSFVLGSAGRAWMPRDTHVWLFSPVSAISGIAAGLVLLVYLNRRYGLWPRDVGLKFGRWPRDLLLAAGLLLLVMAVQLPLAGFFAFLHERVHEKPEPQYVISLMREMKEVKSAWGLGVMTFVAVLAAPVCEEFAFRGVLQPVLRRYLGGPASIVVTAVAFSAIHDPTSRFARVPALVLPLALALGYAYHRTQRLAGPVFLHVLHNALSVAILLLSPDSPVQ